MSLPGKVSENSVSQNVLVYGGAGVGKWLKLCLREASSCVWSPGAKRSILNRNKNQFLVGASQQLRLGVSLLGTWNMFGR